MSDVYDNNRKNNTVLVEIERAKETAAKGIEMAMDRGDQLDEVNEKAIMLSDSAKMFHKSAQKVERQTHKKKWKMISFIVLVIVALIVVVIFFAT